MFLLFYRDSIVYFVALTAFTVVVVVAVAFVALWVKIFFRNSMFRDAKKMNIFTFVGCV